nr:MFS transporter [Streptomyces sp. SID5468]
MDSFIVNVAVPAVRTGLGASYPQVELVVSGYVLAYGLFLVTGGRLGDIHGARRMFQAGLALFTAASLACGLAGSAGALIGFRVAQALGAALFYPQVLSVLQTSFHGRWRERAFAVFGATIGVASVVGQVLGGLLVQADLFGLSWRSVFLLNVPLGLLVLIGAALVMPKVPGGRRRPRLDVRGTLLLTVALLALSLPLIEGGSAGWPAWCWICLAVSVPALAAFFAVERAVAARGGDALIDPRLLRRPAFAGGNLVALVFFAGNAGLFFVLTLQLQSGLGYLPLAAGLTFAPLAIAFVAASLVAPKLQAVAGHRVPAIGYLVNAAGTVALLVTSVTAGERATGWVLLPALVVIGFGEGLGVSPLFGAALDGVPPADSGAASGVLETSTQIGMSLGVTVVGLVFLTALGSGTTPAAHWHAFTAALVANTVLALAALALVPRLTARSARPT